MSLYRMKEMTAMSRRVVRTESQPPLKTLPQKRFGKPNSGFPP
jgi:hypothetical protein